MRRCPNHAGPTWSRPAGTIRIGARLYCFNCTEHLAPERVLDYLGRIAAGVLERQQKRRAS